MKPTAAFLMLISLLLMLMCGVACADLAALDKGADVDAVLDALDARGKNLKDFSADVKLTSTSMRDGTATEQLGKAVYQDRQGASRIKVSFDTKSTIDGNDKKTTQKQRMDYKLEDGWLTDRDYQKKLEVRRQVIRPGQKMNLLKLGEGPFPLPIGQPKAEVKKQFEVAKLETTQDDPKNAIHLEFKPKPGSQFAKRFNKIDFFVDRDTHFPSRIITDEKPDTSRTTDLTNLKINAGLDEGAFTLPDIEKEGWNRREEPFQ